MVKTVNLCLFAVYEIVSEYTEYVNLGEYAKSIYTHMKNTSKDSTLTGMSK
jgi:hypothetical protein